jgi:ATP-dependent helicase HrpA
MQAIAFERITLYGIVVEARRRVNFGPLNPSAAREIFLRQALVGGEVSEEFARRWDFFTHNQQLMLDIETLEHKSRRPDVLVDDELIFAFYDRIVPEGSSAPPLSTNGGARSNANSRSYSTCSAKT